MSRANSRNKMACLSPLPRRHRLRVSPQGFPPRSRFAVGSPLGSRHARKDYGAGRVVVLAVVDRGQSHLHAVGGMPTVTVLVQEPSLPSSSINLFQIERVTHDPRPVGAGGLPS